MSNTATRVLVAVVTIPFLLVCAYIGGFLWFALVALILVFALKEFYLFAQSKGAQPQKLLGYIFSLFILLAFIHDRLHKEILSKVFIAGFLFPQQWQAFLIVIIVLMLVILARELYRNAGSPLLNLGATVLGVLYIGLFLGCAVGIREMFSIAEFPVVKFFGTIDISTKQLSQLHTWGGYTMAAILTTIWICDTAAYFGGRALGKHPLFERVSPKKTWEGAVFGFVFAIAWMILVKHFFLEYLTVGHAVMIGAIIGSLGQIGDLIESLLKRDARMKDSSSIIPGHGGAFDRFDSFIFVSPILFLYLDFIVFA